MDLPKSIVPIECKWIYKRKIGANGKVEIFKARLMVEGYSLCEGIDYQETFSFVAILKSIHILLAVVAYFDYEI